MHLFILLIACILICPILGIANEDQSQSDIMRFETIVRGNEEQPKVIIIRPWMPVAHTKLTLPEYPLEIPKRLLRTRTDQLIDP